MGIGYLRIGELVTRICEACKRQPREGETYGPHDAGWDFTNICPECWDQMFAEEEDR